ncbi:unnamed protein product [Arctia plantaginis]|uniref:Transmembrane protein 135 N-terminal domain-containing protein n=1 Tax=Arctia plantaginis TaxID=874455 RepID=A0A8S1B0S0_ARCPL|nr:unnamed protein product [Arctia plantaginis]CAB3251291.1 unnamed protein product [Arctia plantaginis]
MVAFSKDVFDTICRDKTCDSLVHPWTKGCFKAALMIYASSIVGSAKFYSLVYLAQILMRGKKMAKKEEWIKMGRFYVRSTLLGLLVSAVGLQLICLIRKLIGKFTYHSCVLIPYTLSGIFIYLEPPARRGLVINLFCNLLIEYFLRSLQRAGYLSITKSKQTLMFMVGSSLLFYLMRLEGDKEVKTPLFWFFSPEKVRKKSDESPNVCPHNGECKKHILKGASAYFGIGLGISLAKLILPQIRTPLKAISTIRGKHLTLALFFSSYIGIYRAIICYLCRKKGFDSAFYALPAGYVAGLSFLFNPNLGLSIASVTAALKLYATILYEKKILPSSIPLPEIMYCLCQGVLFSARVMDPDVCPRYVFNLMDSVSNKRSLHVTKSLYETLKVT